MMSFSKMSAAREARCDEIVAAGGRSAIAAAPAWVRGVALFLLAFSTVMAAPLQRELGYGLLYVRVQHLPADLPAKPSGRAPACVIDLRYLNANEEAARDFSAWLHQRATTRSPVFVLANAETSSPLLKVLSGHRRGSGIAVVGIPNGSFRPDVAVESSAENERRAYEALAKGADIGALLTDNPDKVRNDEASLSKDRLAEASAEAADASDDKEAPPVDATLQRAVHLHRALVALRKI